MGIRGRFGGAATWRRKKGQIGGGSRIFSVPRLSSMTIYNEKGSTIHPLLIKNDEWDDIIPVTNGDILGKIICSGSRQ